MTTYGEFALFIWSCSMIGSYAAQSIIVPHILARRKHHL